MYEADHIQQTMVDPTTAMRLDVAGAPIMPQGYSGSHGSSRSASPSSDSCSAGAFSHGLSNGCHFLQFHTAKLRTRPAHNPSSVHHPSLPAEFNPSTVQTPATPSSGLPALLRGTLTFSTPALATTDGEQKLADDLKALSLQDREKVYEEVHGIHPASSTTKSEEFVNRHLELLEACIQSRRKKRDAFSRAAFLAPAAVKDRALRLTMLKGADWNPENAALFMFKHFTMKRDVWGEEAFLRPIVWDDLPEDAKESLRDGAIVRHEPTIKSVSGKRGLVVFHYPKFKFGSAESFIKATWYINRGNKLTLASDPTRMTQSGIVTISNFIGAHSEQILHAMRGVHAATKIGICNIIPIRFTSNHFLFPDSSAMQAFLKAFVLAAPQEIRLRSKFHFGSHLECMYALGTYGVSSHLLPFDFGGNMQQDVADKSIEELNAIDRRMMEEYEHCKSLASLIHHPGKNDVLLGRGWPYQSYPGNVLLMNFLEKQCCKMYEQASTKLEKTTVLSDLTMKVMKLGVRFLKRDESGDYWEQVALPVARQKIAMSIRNISRR